jgi:hypothetical protein
VKERTGDFYLIAKPKGYAGLSFELKSKKPTVIRDGGVPIRVSVSLPDALFERPQFQAKVRVDPKQVSQPVIEAEVVNNIEETIRAQTGLDLKIEVVSEGNAQ